MAMKLVRYPAAMKTKYRVFTCLLAPACLLIHSEVASAECLRSKYKASVTKAFVANFVGIDKKTQAIVTESHNELKYCLSGSRVTADLDNLSAELNGGKATLSQVRDGVPVTFFLEGTRSGNIYTFHSGFTGEFGMTGKGVLDVYVKFSVKGSQCKIIAGHAYNTSLNRSGLGVARNENFLSNIECQFD
ncbi:hypothetical protein [Methylobacterium aerolatum]|nr:hypothetical protein [Methylobacterium aerolatum]